MFQFCILQPKLNRADKSSACAIRITVRTNDVCNPNKFILLHFGGLHIFSFLTVVLTVHAITNYQILSVVVIL